MSFRGYRGLTVWNRTIDLVELAYRLTGALRDDAPAEILTAIRRAALALPSHLAEGYQSSRTDEYLRHVHTSQLILAKLETNVTVLERLEWADDEDVREMQTLLTHIDHLLQCLERYLLGEQPRLETG